MASYQRIALFVFFDSIEKDMINTLRGLSVADQDRLLSDDERTKALARVAQDEVSSDNVLDFELLQGLDIGDKYSVILRHKDRLPASLRAHYLAKRQEFERSISVRNSLMHGRPLTIDEYGRAFALAGDLIKSPGIWPILSDTFKKYHDDPQSVMRLAVAFMEDGSFSGVFNNLPAPDYDDTGFFPRPALEKELKKKILARHPVITVLGDGGNGKTAITLQTLYGLLDSNDHGFDAIVWVSAKSSKLTTAEIERIEDAINSSLEMFEAVAGLFEQSDLPALERVRKLLEFNKILLVVDNLETILDESVRSFAQDVPGDSKIVFTSRVPLGADLTVQIDAFSEKEAISYLRILISAYNIAGLKKSSNDELRLYVGRLGHKPLLLKWFALGVLSGLTPHSIIRNPKTALQFCMENVFSSLSQNAKKILSIMAQIPSSVSPIIVQHVGDFDAKNVEAAFAELIQFAIIEQTTENKYETSYQIKPFAKSYLIRIFNVSIDESKTFLDKYRRIEGAYQDERGAAAHDLFNIRTFCVRSKSEALAVQRLRRALAAANKENYNDAFDIIEDTKIANPDYFEVYRCEALVAYKQCDHVRANSAYETAIELDQDQPQLHFFYGGFLMRAYKEFRGAADQFDLALKLSPNTLEILREAVRAKLYDLDFGGAQSHVDYANEIGFTTPRFKTIFTDLQLQIFYRKIEFLINRNNNLDPIRITASEMRHFLSALKSEIIDATLAEHLVRARRIVARAESEIGQQLLLELTALFDKLEETGPSGIQVGLQSENQEDARQNLDLGRYIGRMKVQGRKPTYAFLQSSNVEDTFVAKSTVDAAVWRGMTEGARVTYSIAVLEDGRRKAFDVVLAD